MVFPVYFSKRETMQDVSNFYHFKGKTAQNKRTNNKIFYYIKLLHNKLYPQKAPLEV